MKQKIVIQVSLMNGNKSRSKAMQIAVAASGVESVSFKDDRSQLVVTGEFDAAVLTRLLRKRVGHADLLSVANFQVTWPYYNAVPDYERRVATDNCFPLCTRPLTRSGHF